MFPIHNPSSLGGKHPLPRKKKIEDQCKPCKFKALSPCTTFVHPHPKKFRYKVISGIPSTCARSAKEKKRANHPLKNKYAPETPR